MWSDRRLTRALACLLGGILAASCTKKSAAVAPDAGVVAVLAAPEVGFRLELLPTWTLAPLDAAARQTGKVAEAFRQPVSGRVYLAAPRIALTIEPTTAPDTDTAIQRTQEDLRQLDTRPGVQIERRTLGNRFASGVQLGDLELTYSVKDPQRDTAREVVHRSLVTRRVRPDGQATVLTLTVTYLVEDADVVTSEIQRMLSTLSFSGAPDGGT